MSAPALPMTGYFRLAKIDTDGTKSYTPWYNPDYRHRMERIRVAALDEGKVQRCWIEDWAPEPFDLDGLVGS